MKLEFDSVNEMVGFLQSIGYTVYKGIQYVPQDNSPFYPNPYPVTYENIKDDPNLSKKIMCKDIKVDNNDPSSCRTVTTSLGDITLH